MYHRREMMDAIIYLPFFEQTVDITISIIPWIFLQMSLLALKTIFVRIEKVHAEKQKKWEKEKRRATHRDCSRWKMRKIDRSDQLHVEINSNKMQFNRVDRSIQINYATRRSLIGGDDVWLKYKIDQSMVKPEDLFHYSATSDQRILHYFQISTTRRSILIQAWCLPSISSGM